MRIGVFQGKKGFSDALSWAPLLVLFLILLSFTSRPISGPHAFRQAHTAFPVRMWLENGFSFFRPEVPIKGINTPWPFEFPAFQGFAYVIHKILTSIGLNAVSVDQSIRVSGLIFFALNIMLLVITMRMKYAVSPLVVTSIIMLSLVNPYIFLWSTTGLIDWFALFFGSASAYLLFFPKNALRRSRDSKISFIIAVTLLSTGLMVKGPTAFSGFLFYFILSIPSFRDIDLQKLRLSAGSFVVSLIPFFLWQQYVKTFTPVGDPKKYIHVDSENISWYFGTREQYLKFNDYLDFIVNRLSSVTYPIKWIMILVFLTYLLRKSLRFQIVTITLTCLTYLFIFVNLNTVHDYYQIAIIIPCLFLTVVLPILVFVSQNSKFPMVIKALGFFVLITFVGFNLKENISNPEGAMYYESLTAESSGFDTTAITRQTRLNDGVITLGWPDDPAPLYAANRIGFAIGHSYDFEWIGLNKQQFQYLWVKDGFENDAGITVLGQIYSLKKIDRNVYRLE